MASSRSAAAAAAGFFYTTSPTGCPDSVAACNNLVEGVYVVNPYHIFGPREGFEAKAVTEDLYVRVDMPGVEEDDVEVRLENGTVFIKGEARKEWEQEMYGRLYCGSIDLLPESGKKVAVLKKDFKNGVLTMVLDTWGFRPKFSPTTVSQFSTNNLEFSASWSLIGNYLLLNKEIPLLCPPNKYICYYPFQVGGVNGAYEPSIVDSDHLFLREDMPGVSPEKLNLKFNNRAVFFAGDEAEHDERRRYFGRFHLKCDCCNITDIKSDMKAGVLRMLVTKEKFKSCAICNR